MLLKKKINISQHFKTVLGGVWDQSKKGGVWDQVKLAIPKPQCPQQVWSCGGWCNHFSLPEGCWMLHLQTLSLGKGEKGVTWGQKHCLPMWLGHPSHVWAAAAETIPITCWPSSSRQKKNIRLHKKQQNHHPSSSLGKDRRRGWCPAPHHRDQELALGRPGANASTWWGAQEKSLCIHRHLTEQYYTLRNTV